MTSLLWTCLLWACIPTSQAPETTCFTEPPEEGEVRIHPLSCFAERSNQLAVAADTLLKFEKFPVECGELRQHMR